MKGQLNFETSILGRAIVDIAKREDVKTIVEIGTFNGMGSTRCILEGLKGRTNYLFHSYECCNEHYNEAIKNNEKFMGDKFKIILGKIVEESEIAKWFDNGDLGERENSWIKADLKNMKEVKNVFHTVPDDIDLLVLDGGEFSTYPEYRLLKSRSRIIALDDTKTRKCKKIKEELLQSDAKIILDSDERHGVAIFSL
tara:strand:+ start:11732 stop:12322 length:591 start_codon:yes stop_codon:yes gene_type:complete